MVGGEVILAACTIAMPPLLVADGSRVHGSTVMSRKQGSNVLWIRILDKDDADARKE